MGRVRFSGRADWSAREAVDRPTQSFLETDSGLKTHQLACAGDVEVGQQCLRDLGGVGSTARTAAPGGRVQAVQPVLGGAEHGVVVVPALTPRPVEQREGGYGVSISVDAVGEFKILQNAFAAEYGRGTTIVNATIKSGSNEFHGAVFEFLRNEKLDARYSYNFTNTKSPLRQNQFGTSVGGPIIHNKTFFFLNYESERVRRGSIGYTNMPTQAQLGGDLGHAAGGVVVLLLITVLNVYKPQGLTPYGWRKQHELRSTPPRHSPTSTDVRTL